MKKLLLVLASFVAIQAFATNRIKDKTEAVSLNSDDWLFLDGANGGTRKFDPHKFVPYSALSAVNVAGVNNGGLVDWSQLVNVPAGFADGVDASSGAGGDFSSNTSSSVDGEVILFSGTAGKTGKRATGSGLAKLTSGVLGTATAGTDYLTPSGSAASLTGFPTLNQNTTGSAATLTTGRTIAITGDLAYTSGTFNGSANATGVGTLATVNGNVGSFTNANITVNAKGLVTAVANGTAGAGDVVAANQNALTYYPSITGTSLATGSQTAAIGKAYYTALTSNLTVTSFTGTAVSNSEITFELNGCNGTATFTFPSAKRRGDVDSATTTLTPSAGNHIFQFKYNLANTTWYYTDTVTGPLNLAGGATVVTGNLPAANVAAGALASGMTATTQTAADNSTKVATTAYTDAAVKATAASVNLGNCTGTINIDWSAVPNGGMFRGVLTGNTTFTFSNGADGKTIIVDVGQTGTNTFTVAWPSMKWPAGTAPTMTTGAATSDITTIIDVNAVFKGNSVQNVK